jgi:hypothetical protein
LVQFGFCSDYNSPDVLIVELAFKISIPFRNPHAGVEKTGPLENIRNLGTLQLVYAETPAGSLFRQVWSRGTATEISKI